jgi:hypothetical protein
MPRHGFAPAALPPAVVKVLPPLTDTWIGPLRTVATTRWPFCETVTDSYCRLLPALNAVSICVQVVPPLVERYMPPPKATATMVCPVASMSSEIQFASGSVLAFQVAPESRERYTLPGITVAASTVPAGLEATQCQVVEGSEAAGAQANAVAGAAVGVPATGAGAAGVGAAVAGVGAAVAGAGAPRPEGAAAGASPPPPPPPHALSHKAASATEIRAVECRLAVFMVCRWVE